MKHTSLRRAAREAILTAANRRRSSDLPPLRMRHLHTAVQTVRHYRLVKDEVLIQAGFRPSRSAGR